MAEKRGKAAFFSDDDFSVEETPVVAELPKEPVRAATASESGTLSEYSSPVGTQGRKGQKAPRMNLAIPEDVYEYIRRESRKEGMTYSEFICAVMRQRAANNKK